MEPGLEPGLPALGPPVSTCSVQSSPAPWGTPSLHPLFTSFPKAPLTCWVLPLGPLVPPLLPAPPHLFSNTTSGRHTMVDGTLSTHRPS